MKIIDDTIREAMHKIKLCTGTNEEVGKKLGMTGKHVSSILSGKTLYFEDTTWKKIESVLKPYIKPVHSATNTEFPILNTDEKIFPVISDAAAAECNTSYIPLAEYAKDNSDEMRYFDLGQPGDVVIRVMGDSMLPWYPPGTLILVRPNKRPINGQRVVAILEDGEVIFKIFGETKDHFHLLSLNSHDGKDFHFKKDDYHSIRSIWIVIQSARNEMELDKAMQKAGIRHQWEDKLENFEK